MALVRELKINRRVVIPVDLKSVISKTTHFKTKFLSRSLRDNLFSMRGVRKQIMYSNSPDSQLSFDIKMGNIR